MTHLVVLESLKLPYFSRETGSTASSGFAYTSPGFALVGGRIRRRRLSRVAPDDERGPVSDQRSVARCQANGLFPKTCNGRSGWRNWF